MPSFDSIQVDSISASSSTDDGLLRAQVVKKEGLTLPQLTKIAACNGLLVDTHFGSEWYHADDDELSN